MKEFDIPIALFMFKRIDKTPLIIDRIAQVKPKKIYLIGDGPRNEKENLLVQQCRKSVEEHITWDCEIIKNYASKNRGVYQNIAGGAQWVFSKEECAIFLEDDNLPVVSFFFFCEELLRKYEDDNRILWICGTNYLGKYSPADGSDYMFTRLMLPCGWASWSKKFLKFYDGHLNLYRNDYIKKHIKETYENKLLYKHDFPAWKRIINSIDNQEQPSSWDYQMAFSLRVHNLLGIAPKYNQITNIGADMDSIHGGTSMSLIMTSRFCENPSYEMPSTLNHPISVHVDNDFERAMEKVILPPLKIRLKAYLGSFIKYILFIPQEEPLSRVIKKRLRIS